MTEKLKFLFFRLIHKRPAPRPISHWNRESDTGIRTHPPSPLPLSPASSAVGGSPRRNLGVDLGAGLLCPCDERAGPGGACGSPRDVEPGLMERRELPDLFSELILCARARERKGR